METPDDDQPSQENIQEQGITSDDQQEEAATTTSPVRSYDCNFCKRGFSNAQALGGHMNIHRKDKAPKLKKTSSASSLNIAKILASYDPILSIRPSMEVKGSAITTTAAATQWPNWILGAKNDAVKMDKTQLGEVDKLPLFVERSPSSCPEKDLSLSSPEEDNLDLELRLGPEPKSATGTKKFF